MPRADTASPSAEWGRYPGACSWLRIDAEGHRRRTVRTYDAARITSEVTYDESGAGHALRSRHFVYDASGRPIREESYDRAEALARRMQYDDAGRLVAIEEASNRGSVRTRQIFYDARGRMSFERTVDGENGRVLSFRSYERDGVGEVTLEHLDGDRGSPRQIEVRRADGSVERVHRSLPTRAPFQRDVYAFDGAGRLSGMVRHGDVRLTQRYARDPAGNLLRVDTWDDHGEPIAVTVYDYGCW